LKKAAGESSGAGSDSALSPRVGWQLREPAHSPGSARAGIPPDQSTSGGAVDAPLRDSRRLPSAGPLAITRRVVRSHGRERVTTAVRCHPVQSEMGGSDITFVATREGWLSVAVLLDLYSLRVVGWAMGARITTDLTHTALTMAVQRDRVEHVCCITRIAVANIQRSGINKGSRGTVCSVP